jgi:predicted ATPase
LYCGEFDAACRHAEVGIGLYRPKAHHLLGFTSHDAGVCCRGTLGIACQFLGYSERATERMTEALSLSASLNHPQTRIVALTLASWMHALRRDAAQVRTLAETTAEECRQQGVPTFEACAELMRAWAEAALSADGAAPARMRGILAEMAERRFLVRRSFYLGLQAAACLAANAAADGLAAIEEALAFVEAHGERWYEPELHRQHGELLLRTSRDGYNEAEAAFRRALGAARAAGARWLELRAAASLARIWAERGERGKAYDLLAPVYGWFTQGLNMPDLQDARALLNEMRP